MERFESQAWIKDRRSRFLHVNSAFARSLGCRPIEVVGNSESPFFSSYRVAEFRDTDRAAVSAGKGILVDERGTRDASEWFETLKVPIPGPSGTPVATLGLAFKVTRWHALPHGFADFPHERARSERACSAPKLKPRWLLEAVEMFCADAFGTLTASKVAACLGVHPDTLGRRFKDRFGIGVSEYRRWLRARRARNYIMHSGLTLSDIAAICGYSDQSHLSQDFKEFFAATPGAFRELNLLNASKRSLARA